MGRLGKDLIITPLLDCNSQVGEASVDLRLGREFIVAKHTKISSLDPIKRSTLERTIPQYQEKIKLDFGRPYILHPQELVLASTLEFIALPRNLMAYVVGRSSWGRLGLIIATATMVDPLYRGVVTLELVNLGRIPIHLYPCSRIAQLVLHDVPNGEEASECEHKYQDSFEPSFSLIHRDKELPKLVDQPFQFAIGLTGLRGAGKSEVVNYLTTEKNFRLFNISDIVRGDAKEQGLDPDRPTLQDYGDEMRKRDDAEAKATQDKLKKTDHAIPKAEPNNADRPEKEHDGKLTGHLQGSCFARKMLEIIREKCTTSDEFLVITGIRNPGEAIYLRREIRNFFLIAIEADPDIRYRRRQEEGVHQDRMEFEKLDERDLGTPTQPYGQDIGGCTKLAHDNEYGFVVGNGAGITKQELRRKIDEILNDIYRKLS
ncbi:MAG: dCTP deaminase [Acidobacteriia bacterium]|nr:dCTP deaminase [Terriglobia bacterium]